ncbi:hypothetical protein VP01_2655g3 [Puccinia sorghi]|uniref:SAM domain-containing protein n=1 Tax=Puccinia sorghi TaxID=27349 RepID=A0A0L6V429_9BASI|nr:hypothetical protein VP01_2655g3 [Puccinia sorghi]
MASREGSVKIFLESLGLGDYLSMSVQFLAEGFDTIQYSFHFLGYPLEAIQEITEEDLEEMRVKRGHRRTLQRALGIRFATNAVVDKTRLEAGSPSQAPISPPLFSGGGRLHGAFTQRSGSWDHESSQSESPLFAGVERNLSPPQLHCGPTCINRSGNFHPSFSCVHKLPSRMANYSSSPRPSSACLQNPRGGTAVIRSLSSKNRFLHTSCSAKRFVRSSKSKRFPFQKLPESLVIAGRIWNQVLKRCGDLNHVIPLGSTGSYGPHIPGFRTGSYQQHCRYLQKFKEAQQVRNSASQPSPQRCPDAGRYSARSLGVKSECNDNSCEASDVESEERDDVMSNPVVSSSTSQADPGANGSSPSPRRAGGSVSERPQPATSASGYPYHQLPLPHISHYCTRPTIPNLRTLDKHLTESQTLFFKSNRSVRTHP